ncbi:MAG: aquaporin [Phycisphaerae bacterium]|nr:aquaporin [Phycisphaerae bacterium]
MSTMYLNHLPEYLIESVLLAVFMLSACLTSALVQHPSSVVARRIAPGLGRRAVIGVFMGLTAVALITSSFGKRSGAHMNPATTLAYLLLGKVRAIDALGYVLGQFAGGLAGVGVARLLLGRVVTHEPVRCVVTAPSDHSWGAQRTAWLAEFGIAFILLLSVLAASNHRATASYTPWLVGSLVALFITFEAPFSGMSMNPARTIGSAVHAREFRALWVYCTAPPLAMCAAAVIYTALAGDPGVYCAKMDHRGDLPCLFICRIGELNGVHTDATPRDARHPILHVSN